MKKIIGVLFGIILLLMVNCVFAEEEKEDWQYVITKWGITYSVDMKSVRFSGKYMLLFYLTMDNYNNEISRRSLTAINMDKQEYRFESDMTYNRKSFKVLSFSDNPSKWYSMDNDNPMLAVLVYILENHPETKNITKETKEAKKE